MIVGPPGAGKTTALKHSGLVFPSLDPRSGGGMRGVGGTRNCDWWFTNEAILLDTAGRYATEADDHDEWIAFLDMLKRYRSAKPINGVLVAISVTDLIEATDEQIDAFAKRLRARIDEVADRLQMLVPVYVMFTKVDLVAGFVEFWGDLRKSERGQIWGVTFPLAGADKRDPAQAFEQEFDLLVERVARPRPPPRGRRAAARAPPAHLPVPAGVRGPQAEPAGLRRRALYSPTRTATRPCFAASTSPAARRKGGPSTASFGGMMRAFNLAAPCGAAAVFAAADRGQELLRHGPLPPRGLPGPARGGAHPGGGQEAARQPHHLLHRGALRRGVRRPAVALHLRAKHVAGDRHARHRRTSPAHRLAQTPRRRSTRCARSTTCETRSRCSKDGTTAACRWAWAGGCTPATACSRPCAGSMRRAWRRRCVQPVKAQLEHELAPAAGQTRSSIEQYGAYFARLKAYLSMTDPQRIQGDDGDREINALTEVWARTIGVTLGARQGRPAAARGGVRAHGGARPGAAVDAAGAAGRPRSRRARADLARGPRLQRARPRSQRERRPHHACQRVSRRVVRRVRDLEVEPRGHRRGGVHAQPAGSPTCATRSTSAARRSWRTTAGCWGRRKRKACRRSWRG